MSDPPPPPMGAPPPPPPPMTARGSVTLQGRYPLGQKNKYVYGLLAIFLGFLGIHYFYIGLKGKGFLVILVCALGWIILEVPLLIVCVMAVITAIRAMTRSDEDFYNQYICQARWI